MAAIFISYRKEDAPGPAAHLFKNLSESFGAGTVVMDVARSQPGRDVRQVVDDNLDACAVVLVVIGKGWAADRDESGQRKLDSVQDVVRIETAAALRHDVPIIPVLVQGAGMVQPADLPPDLADLAFRNPVTLSDSHWGTDVETLVTLLRSLVQGQEQGLAGAGPAPSTGVTGRQRADAQASASTRARGARAQPLAQSRWRVVFIAAAVVAGAAMLGVFALIAGRQPPVDRAVAEAQQAATVAVAKAEAAKAEAEVAQAEARKNLAQPEAPRAQAESAQPQPPQEALERPAAKPADAGSSARAADVPGSVAAPAAAARPAEVRPRPPVATATNAAGAPPTEGLTDVPKAARPLPAAASAGKSLSFSKWTLRSGGCGAGPLTVTGTARFSIEQTAEGTIVTEEFRGSGNGFDVVVTGKAAFSQPQPSYDIPTAGQWSGSKVFKTAGTDRLNADDGGSPSGANVVKFQSLCG